MRRGLALTALLLLLFGVCATARLQLEVARVDDPEAALLYLPKGPFLRALAFGHEETLADLLYIWSIQYYSNYSDESRFDYLRQVYLNAITELDPLFTEAYLVGAMIMSWEARDPDMALELYEKALVAMPENWEIAYWAGWECYSAGRYLRARDYWARAARIPDAPPQLIRLAARMLERAGSYEEAIQEYEHILDEPVDERTAEVVRRWLRHTRTQLVVQKTQEAVDAFRLSQGSCPSSLEELRSKGMIPRLPENESGESYVLDRDSCRVVEPSGDALGATP